MRSNRVEWSIKGLSKQVIVLETSCSWDNSREIKSEKKTLKQGFLALEIISAVFLGTGFNATLSHMLSGDSHGSWPLQCTRMLLGGGGSKDVLIAEMSGNSQLGIEKRFTVVNY